ncbi:MAG TPA: LysM peptidoglycan-binding domain-containing protein [Sporichthyaceae bacterium]
MNTATLPENAGVVVGERPIRMRLTRRGQGVLLAVLLAGIFVAGLAFGAAAHGADSDSAPVAHRTVVVQPGQTLWALARQVSPHRDPRVVVESIRELNALSGAGIQAGQELLLP